MRGMVPGTISAVSGHYGARHADMETGQIGKEPANFNNILPAMKTITRQLNCTIYPSETLQHEPGLFSTSPAAMTGSPEHADDCHGSSGLFIWTAHLDCS